MSRIRAFPPWIAHSLLSFMSHPAFFTPDRPPLRDHEQKQTALSYLNEAWAEARHEGVDGDCLAQASLFAASPNWSVPTAKTRWRNSSKVFRGGSATASFRSRCEAVIVRPLASRETAPVRRSTASSTCLAT